MKVVLDTNLLLVIISNRSKDHDIFLSLLNLQFEILEQIEFPKVTVIGKSDFRKRLGLPKS